MFLIVSSLVMRSSSAASIFFFCDIGNGSVACVPLECADEIFFLENLLDVWIVFHIFAAQMPMCDCDEVSKIINNHSIMISKYLYYFIMSI